MHSLKRYLNDQIVTFHAKCPQGDQNLQITPLSETTSIPITFIIMEVHPSPSFSGFLQSFLELSLEEKWNNYCKATSKMILM